MTHQQPNAVFTPAIHLLFTSPTVSNPDEKVIADHIASLDEGIPPADVWASWHHRDAQQSLGEIRFGDHLIQVTGFAAPLPNAVINSTVNVAHWQPQIKAAMRQHRTHINLIYQGQHHDPIEKMIALYKTASAFANENLVGIANPQAWTAHPPADFLSAEKIASYRSNFPFMLWVGYIKFFIDKERYWLTTKGHHIFDVPDLAYFIKFKDNTDGITNLFANIFYYLYENDVVVTAGDTLEIGVQGQHMRFSKTPEDAEFLMGPSGTLVVKPVSPEDNPSEN